MKSGFKSESFSTDFRQAQTERYFSEGKPQKTLLFLRFPIFHLYTYLHLAKKIDFLNTVYNTTNRPEKTIFDMLISAIFTYCLQIKAVQKLYRLKKFLLNVAHFTGIDEFNLVSVLQRITFCRNRRQHTIHLIHPTAICSAVKFGKSANHSYISA